MAPLRRSGARIRRAALGLGRTYQITNLFPRLTVLENCLLAAVGLHGKQEETVRSLSHGEQRQLEIALALAGSPKLLLLDEPIAGLPPAESHSMAALLKTLDPAITLLIIEHDMDTGSGPIAEALRRSSTEQARAQAERLAAVSYDEILGEQVVYGSPDAVVERLRMLREELGFSSLSAWMNVGGQIPHASLRSSMRLFAERVAPRL